MNTDIFSYGAHPLQKARVFQYSASNKNTLLFIHGGAWRDPNNTYNDFAHLIHTLQTSHCMHDTNMVSMNYRLSPEVQHPAHLLDVLECIRYMVHEGCGRLSLVGHSVGATLMMQLLNLREMIKLKSGEYGNFGDFNNSHTFSDFFNIVDFSNFYFVDGIYDLVDLVQEYGDPYRDFVDMAFDGDYAEASQLSWKSNTGLDLIPERLVVVYSEQDELLSERQSQCLVSYLRAHNLPIEYLRGQWGRHEEVYRRAELAAIIAQRQGASAGVSPEEAVVVRHCIHDSPGEQSPT